MAIRTRSTCGSCQVLQMSLKLRCPISCPMSSTRLNPPGTCLQARPPSRSERSHQSSSGGNSSSMYRINDIRISVVSLPRSTSLIKCASTCICTISSAPRSTPQKILEYHSSSCARPSSGNSTKSASGFSSNTRENCLLSLVQFATVGVMLRNILKPTWSILVYGQPTLAVLPNTSSAHT